MIFKPNQSFNNIESELPMNQNRPSNGDLRDKNEKDYNLPFKKGANDQATRSNEKEDHEGQYMD